MCGTELGYAATVGETNLKIKCAMRGICNVRYAHGVSCYGVCGTALCYAAMRQLWYRQFCARLSCYAISSTALSYAPTLMTQY
eukprot:739088-Rhodomonas_salina.2